jgi:hypothetical protein
VLVATASAARVHGTKHADRIDSVNGRRDVVSCGRGRDLATVDGFDRVARDCEVVTRRISRDPYRGAPSQHETEVEPDSAAFGSTVVAVFQVGRIFDGGSKNIGFAVSQDAGRTWKRGLLHSLVYRASDPSVAYDEKHGFWLVSSLVFAGNHSSIDISRSKDGRLWTDPYIPVATDSGLGQDKEWVACDNWPASPHFGTCYLSYSDVLGEQIVTQASSDAGQTWSAAATAAGFPGRGAINGAFAPGVQPLVLPSGRVLVPYYDEGQFSTLISDDGGATWTARLGIARAKYRTQAGLRVAPLPTSAVSSDGRAYLAWADCSFRSGCAANDIVYTSTADGITWTPVKRITTGGDAELPGLDADPARPGRLALAYYVLRGSSLDVRFTSSRNAGASWSKPQLLNSRSVRRSWIARTSLGSMVGDYISTSFAGSHAVPVFPLAERPRGTRLQESMFATSLPVG